MDLAPQEMKVGDTFVQSDGGVDLVQSFLPFLAFGVPHGDLM